MLDSIIEWNEDLTITPDITKSFLIIVESEYVKHKRIIPYFFSLPYLVGQQYFSYAKDFKELEQALHNYLSFVHVYHYEKIIAWGYMPEIK